MGSEMCIRDSKVAQKSSTEPFESSENDLKIKNVNVHKIIEKSMKIIDF